MQSRVLWCALVLAESALKNFGTALGMWFSDHQSYPRDLQELVPNYLRTVPSGPGGSSQDWLYDLSPDGLSYSLSTRGEHFAPLGLAAGLPRFDLKSGLEPVLPRPEGLSYQFALPPELDAQDWLEVRAGCYWTRGHQVLYFRLGGPSSQQQSGPEWVQEMMRERVGYAEVLSQEAVQLAELQGFEQSLASSRHRVHQFIVSDGELGWHFFYEAPLDEFDEAVDRAFVEMIARRSRPV